MPTVTFPPELYQRLEQVAEQQHCRPEEILVEAIRLYRWRLDHSNSPFAFLHEPGEDIYSPLDGKPFSAEVTER